MNYELFLYSQTMAKVSTTFFCKNCGVSSGKWIGKCPSCGEWNTYVEEVIHKEKVSYKKTWKPESKSLSVLKPVLLADVEKGSEDRFPVKDIELSRVLGGGNCSR
jgi:DNA repair protein RadA/Sms